MQESLFSCWHVEGSLQKFYVRDPWAFQAQCTYLPKGNITKQQGIPRDAVSAPQGIRGGWIIYIPEMEGGATERHVISSILHSGVKYAAAESTSE